MVAGGPFDTKGEYLLVPVVDPALDDMRIRE